MPDYTVVGTEALTPRKRVSTWNDKLTIKVTSTGTLADCDAGVVPRGGFYDEENADPTIAAARCVESIVTQGDAGSGELVVTYEAPNTSGESPEPLGEPIYEIEFTEMTKKIENHPLCGVLTGTNNLTWDDWQNFTEDDYAGISLVGGDPGWTLAEYLGLKKHGEDEYLTFWPRVRRTLTYFFKPDDVGTYAGIKQDPPVGSFAGVGGENGIIFVEGHEGGWQWLGGPDRCVKKGRTYERVTEWLGCAKVDTKLYPH